MLLGLFAIVCSILAIGMADHPIITDYPDVCPTLQNLHPANFTTAMLEDIWYENYNTDSTGYRCAYYTHRSTGVDTINSTFSADFKTNSGYTPDVFQLLWELKNSTNPRANGAACMVTQGHIIKGPYWFCLLVPKVEYIAYSCDGNGTQTLHIVTTKKDANKEYYMQTILNCGIPKSLYDQLEVSYSTNTCSN